MHMEVRYQKTLFIGTRVLLWLLLQIRTPYQRSLLVKNYPRCNLHPLSHLKEWKQDSIIVLPLSYQASVVNMKSRASMVGQGSWDRLYQWVKIRPISTILHISSRPSKCSSIPPISRLTLTTKQRQSRRDWPRQQVKSTVGDSFQSPRRIVLCSQFFWHPKVQDLILQEVPWWCTTWPLA